MGRKPTTDTIRKVQKLYQEDELARRFFDLLAARVRDATSTTVDNIARTLNVSRGDAVALARKIGETGAGELYLGRRGSKTRIQWKFSCVSVGQAAAGEVTELEAPHDPEPENASEELVTQEVLVTKTPNMTIAEAKRLLAASLGLEERHIEILIKA